MIEVYIQISSMSCPRWDVFRVWTHKEKVICQRLADRYHCEVRAIRADRVLGRFVPSGGK